MPSLLDQLSSETQRRSHEQQSGSVVRWVCYPSHRLSPPEDREGQDDPTVIHIDEPRWKELCRQASVEQNADKLRAMIAEIVSALLVKQSRPDKSAEQKPKP